MARAPPRRGRPPSVHLRVPYEEVLVAAVLSSVTPIRQRRSMLPVLGEGPLPPEDEALVRRAALAAKPKDQDFEDVQQAVLEEYWRKLSSYDASAGVPLHGFLWPHLVGAARHVVRQDRDVRRKNGLGFEIPVDDMTLYDAPAAPDLEADPIASHEVHRFVRRLDSTTRYIIVRHYWHDATVTRIAREVGMRPQSVQRRLDKAMVEARKTLSLTYMEAAA